MIYAPIEGANKNSSTELTSIFEESGFVFREAESGAGPADIYHQVIAFLSIHVIFTSLLVNITASYIIKILDKLYLWYKNNYPKDSQYLPSINIYLYPMLPKKKNIFMYFNINKKHDKKDIIKKMKESLKDLKD
ncbi:MAG: hypothetical protein UV71_C0015G0026 [Microgenomates group bacterium GW2011_GWC1_43_13]|nr:MAG: hypothetical protein UV71_C0015G0026 [Microgenomates group bacterium GW2011_GWC1_43_13]